LRRGIRVGAVNFPVEEMVPATPFPGSPGALAPQVTAVEIGMVDEVATTSLNCTVWPTWRSRAVGFTETLIGGAATVTVLETAMELSATLVAVTVTVVGLGGYAGAV
jgi:hypothetical protein